MASKRSCTASGDGPQHLQVLVDRPGPILFLEAITLDAKDVGHLHGRPAHLSVFR